MRAQNNLTSEKEVPCDMSDQIPRINAFQVQGLYCACAQEMTFSIPQPLCGDSVPLHEEKKKLFFFFFVSLPYMLLSDVRASK